MRITKTVASLAAIVVGAGVLAGAALAETGTGTRGDPAAGGPGYSRAANGFGPGAMMSGNGSWWGGSGMGWGHRGPGWGRHDAAWGRQGGGWGPGSGCPGRGGAFSRNSF